LTLRVLGPEGKWTLKSIRGGTANVKSGEIAAWPAAAGEIVVNLASPSNRVNPEADLELTLEYVGGEVVSPRGQRTPAGQPYTFEYKLYSPDARWSVNAWTFDEKSDPVTNPAEFAARLKTAPAKVLKPARLEWISGGTFIDGLPRDRVALVAEGRVTLDAATTMDVISDDGAKVWVDGVLVIDRWSVHESELDHASLFAGRHHIKIEYFEQTGWQELQVRFRRD
jgi:hypothetical protein